MMPAFHQYKREGVWSLSLTQAWYLLFCRHGKKNIKLIATQEKKGDLRVSILYSYFTYNLFSYSLFMLSHTPIYLHFVDMDRKALKSSVHRQRRVIYLYYTQTSLIIYLVILHLCFHTRLATYILSTWVGQHYYICQ